MIFSDVSKALSQLGDPRFRRVLLMGLGLTFGPLTGSAFVIYVGAGLMYSGKPFAS